MTSTPEGSRAGVRTGGRAPVADPNAGSEADTSLRRRHGKGAPGIDGRRRAKLALAGGLVLLLLAICVVVSRSPLEVAGTNSVPAPNTTEFLRGNQTLCVSGGTVPPNTTAVRIPLQANVGPRVSVSVSSVSGIATTGTREAGWGAATSVVVPVAPTAKPIPESRVCVTPGPVRYIAVNATAPTSASPTGQKLSTEGLHLEYLRSSGASWLSLAPSIAYHLGLGRAPSGPWVVFLLLALAVIVVSLAVWLAFRDIALREHGLGRGQAQAPGRSANRALRAKAALGRVPRAGWICAAVTVVPNGTIAIFAKSVASIFVNPATSLR